MSDQTPGRDTPTGTDPDARYDEPGYEDKSLGQAVAEDAERVDRLVEETDGDLDEGRYNGYQKLRGELRYNTCREELGARGAERKRWKAIHKANRSLDR